MANDDETATTERTEGAEDAQRRERSAGAESSDGSARSAQQTRDGDAPKKRVRKASSSGTARKPAAKKPASSRPRHDSASENRRSDSAEEDTSNYESDDDSNEDLNDDSGQSPRDDGRDDSPSSSEPARPRINAARAAREAMIQLEGLTNRDAEGVVGIKKNDDGTWTVTVEVCESRRIPDTADVLAEYAVTIDSDGDLTAYSRESRYVRGRTNRGE